jgi:hypothetical protein
MLGYVFWHWPTPSIDVARYEELQRDFHAALASSGPAGFRTSCVYRVEGDAPWLEPARASNVSAYADWYLLEDSAAIDALNVAAVSGVCEQPHTAVAQAMAQGAGSLFALRGDTSPALSSIRHITFLTKPRPMAYSDFYSQLSGVASSESTLWRRALVLGPTPEFAMLTAAPIQPPEQLHPFTLNLSPITPSA